MAPCILHHALSFSNLPVHRRDISPLQEASGAFNRHEGLALLATIAEGGGSRQPVAPLFNHSPLESNLISKILRLRDALDLPCQRPRDALDQLLLDTLEALKIAYPKCLSDLSGNRTSSIKQKHTIIESQSLDQVGKHIIEMLDQVTPTVKEMFSVMERSKDENAEAAWPEDLPEKRSLPPVLCRPRSLLNRENASNHSSDGAEVEVAMPCQDGTVKNTEQCKDQEPAARQEADEGCSTGEDGQTTRCEQPSTPEGDCLLGTTTPPSVSPHPLPAPPPSPVPVTGLPMLLQSWDAIQIDNSTVATVPVPPPTAQTVDQTASTAVPPLPSLEQGGPPAPPLAKVSPAPPPPPPGNIPAALRAKKAASKLKRSTQMGSLYRHLRDRVEGSGCTNGGKRAHGKKPRSPAGTKSDAGQGMADALAEMTKRSTYFRQIEEDAEKHAATILELKDAIGSFQSKDMAELVRFHQHVEQQLVCLTDETQVLARFEGFPSKKLESLRMAATLYAKLDAAVSTLKDWKLQGAPLSQQLDRVEGYFNKIKDDVDTIERSKDEEMKRFQFHNIHFELGVLVRIKECMVDLSSNCMELALKEGQDAKEASSSQAASLSRMLWRMFQLAFRVYNFAGGQDERADRLTSILAREIEAHPLSNI